MKKLIVLFLMFVIFFSSCVTSGLTNRKEYSFNSSDILGAVKVSRIFIAPLFINPNPEAKRDLLFSSLQKEAVKKYGENISIFNIEYRSYWNPIGLLFYFNMLGYAETGYASALVVKKTAFPIEGSGVYKNIKPALAICNSYTINKINIGMHYIEVKELIGSPSYINTTTTSYGVKEQWVYKPYGDTYNRYYVYFDNGYVEAIQK